MILNSKLEFLYSHVLGETNYVGFHKHNCYELVYYIKGSGYSTIGNVGNRYSNHSFTITLPGYEHDERHLEKTELIFIGFHYSGKDILLENGLYYDGYSRKILFLLEEMKLEMSARQANYKLKLDLLVQELLIEIDRLKYPLASVDSELVYIKKFIVENYHRDIDISELAKLSGYSTNHFRRIFKKKTGLSPVNYIIGVRLENARKLLENSDARISDIAQSCGFASASQFCSFFKEEYHETPLCFRKRAVRAVMR